MKVDLSKTDLKLGIVYINSFTHIDDEPENWSVCYKKDNDDKIYTFNLENMLEEEVLNFFESKRVD